MRRFLLAAAMLMIAATAAAAKPVAVVKSGLLDEFGIFTAPLEQALRKQGYQVERRPWWMPEDDRRKIALAAGHSKGADAVLSCPKGTCRKVISIDPTFVNRGCRSGNCDSYYAPENKLPFLICCGGYQAKGAKNIRIKGTPSFFLIAPGHANAPRTALPMILRSTAVTP